MMDRAFRAALEVLQSRETDAVSAMLVIVHTFGLDLKFMFRLSRLTLVAWNKHIQLVLFPI